MPENDDILTRESPQGQTIPYGEHTDQILEIFEAPQPRAIIMFIHGGFWRHAYDRSHARPLANNLRDHNYTCVLPEYRRTGKHGSGGWPHTFDDIRHATQHVLKRYPNHPLVVAGHSAGGHLALWIAANNNHIHRVVALAPVSDIITCAIARIGGDAAPLLLDGTPSQHPQRYRDHNPMDLAINQHTFILHGDHDQQVPISMSRAYSKHTATPLIELPNTGHYELIDPQSTAWSLVLDALRID